jgi:hypothetical protein
MASFYFNAEGLELKKKTGTVVSSVKGSTITLEHTKDKPIELSEDTINNLGLKKGSNVTVEPISNGFLISATPAKKPAASATKGSSPSVSATRSASGGILDKLKSHR